MTPAREETNRLLTAAYQAMEIMLTRGRGFEPFSLVVAPDGTTHISKAVLDPFRRSTIEEQVAYAHHVLRDMATQGEARATAFIAMMQLRLANREGYTDGAVIEIEHTFDGAVNFYVPYTWDGEKPVLQDPIAQRQTPKIFVRPDAAEEARLCNRVETFLGKPLPEGVQRDHVHSILDIFLKQTEERSLTFARLHRGAATVLRRRPDDGSPETQAYRKEMIQVLDAVASYLERST